MSDASGQGRAKKNGERGAERRIDRERERIFFVKFLQCENLKKKTIHICLSFLMCLCIRT